MKPHHARFRVRWLCCLLALGMCERGRAITVEQVTEALDSGVGIHWTAPLSAWSVRTQAGETHDGVDSLRTLITQVGEIPELYGIVSGPGVLRGWRRVSSEQSHDKLLLEIGGVVKAEWSGEGAGTFELPIPRGNQTIRFVYQKDHTISRGADAAWLDQVTFTPTDISPAEALDVAGTPAAALVTFTTTPGKQPWRGDLVGAQAFNGGDVLFAPTVDPIRGLSATVSQPCVVRFRSRIHDSLNRVQESNGLGVSGPAMPTNQLEVDGWRHWRVILQNAGDSITLEQNQLYEPGWSIFLDDWQMEPLAPATLEDALDAPGLTFTADWGTAFSGLPEVPTWQGTTAAGAAHDGVDAVFSTALPGQYLGHQTPTLRSQFEGPGKLSFWWQVQGNPAGYRGDQFGVKVRPLGGLAGLGVE